MKLGFDLALTGLSSRAGISVQIIDGLLVIDNRPLTINNQPLRVSNGN